MKKIILSLFVLIFLTSFVSAAEPINIAILYNYPTIIEYPMFIDDLVNGLREYADFGEIDLIHWADTPNAEILEDYDTVILTTMVIDSALYQNAPIWGDILADYAEAGGGVVLAPFFFSNAGRVEIGGDLDYGKLATPEYAPFTCGGYSFYPLSLTEILIPGHPLIYNVNELTTKYFADVEINPGTTVVAELGYYGIPLAGYKDVGYGRIIGLQAFYSYNPYGYDSNTGDYMQLYRNAAVFSVRGNPLTNIEITGPLEIIENSQYQYNATAYFLKGSEDITENAEWYVLPIDLFSPYYNLHVEKGLLSIGDVNKDEEIYLIASYFENGISKSDYIQIQILSDEDSDKIPDESDICQNTILPELPSFRLIPNHFADIDGDLIFETKDTKNQPEYDSIYTLTDTHGCSCEQILVFVDDRDKEHMNVGCSLGIIEEFIADN